MKIKVRFTFEGEVPEKYKYLAISDWGDEGVDITLSEIEGDMQMVLFPSPEPNAILLKTECLGYEILEVT